MGVGMTPVIFNMANLFEKGTHWVALIPGGRSRGRSRDPPCHLLRRRSEEPIDGNLPEYFDPFSLPGPREIEGGEHGGYIHNTTQYQDENNVLCGYFCLYFLYHRELVERLYPGDSQRVKYFLSLAGLSATDPKSNDRNVASFFRGFSRPPPRKVFSRPVFSSYTQQWHTQSV